MTTENRIERYRHKAESAARIVASAQDELYAEEALGDDEAKIVYLRDKIERWQHDERRWLAGIRAARREQHDQAESEAHATEAEIEAERMIALGLAPEPIGAYSESTGIAS